MTDESFIQTNAQGETVAWVGPDATKLFAATALATALDLYAKHRMQVNRAYTPSKMLEAAGRLCGKTYRRGQHAEACKDVRLWVATMKAALPVFDAAEAVR
jgi:hypothetical protein